MRKIAALPAAALLAGCGSLNPTPPPQPTPASIQDAYTQLSAITSDPVTTWQVGDYAVRSACYAYLNGVAQRSADLATASGALGIGGGAAAMASANPYVGAATALGQAFLTLFQQSGSIPYTTETSMLIEGGLDAVETGVALQLPNSNAQALLDVQKLWWQCSAGGYRMLVSQSIMAGARTVRSTPSVTGVPRLSIDPSPAAQMNVILESASPSAPVARGARGALPAGQLLTAEPESGIRGPSEVPMSHVYRRRSPRLQTERPSDFDPDKASRLAWLRRTMTYIRILDGPRP